MHLEVYVFSFISLIGLPLLVFSAMRDLWKLPKLALRKCLTYYGWCLCLENLLAKEIIRVLMAVLQRDILSDSLYYTVIALLCAVVVGILAAANEKAAHKDVGNEKS